VAGLILLVRHAQAERTNDANDSARGLTDEGRRDFREHVQQLASVTHLEGIATSPYVRAVQTAEILAQAFRVQEVVIRRELVPDRSGSDIFELVAGLKPGWAVVGHNPSLATTAAMALGLKVLPTKLKKGSVLALERKSAVLQFRWLAVPGKRIKSRL
jgi:phosphohistidine phosphatase